MSRGTEREARRRRRRSLTFPTFTAWTVGNSDHDVRMSVFLTTVNSDLTEGRGVSVPLRLNRSLENAVAAGRTSGIEGTSQSVVIHEVSPTDEITKDIAMRGYRNPADAVARSYRDGIGDTQWGVVPKNIETLSPQDARRLRELRGILGDRAPQPIRPRISEESGASIVIWANLPATMAGLPVDPIPQILAIPAAAVAKHGEYIVPRDDIVLDIMSQAHELNPGIEAVYVSAVPHGEKINLSVETALIALDYAAKERAAKDAVLAAEYEALARRAGILS